VIPEPARRPELDPETDIAITQATAELYAAARSRFLEP
jgi:hypothetical protein